MATIAKISVDLVANSARFRRDLNKAQGDAVRFFGKINRQSIKTTKLVAGIGVAAAAMFTFKALKQSADFANALSNVQAKTFGSRKELQGLAHDLRVAAKETKFTATQTAEASVFLAQAGFNIDKIRASIRPTLDLAAATDTAVQNTADIVSNILTSQGIATSKLAGTADVLSLATARSNTNLIQLGEAFKIGGPAARAFNLTIQQSAGLFGTLANSGIQATRAGTALRQAFVAIAKSGSALDSALANIGTSTTRQTKVLARLGVKVRDSNGNIRNFIDIMNELSAAGATATDMVEIFGSRAGSSLATLTTNGTAGLNQLIATLDNATGSAQKMAKIQLDNLVGDTTLLKSQWQEIQLLFTSGGLGNLARSFVQGLTRGLKRLAPFIKTASKYMDELAIVLAVVGGALMIGTIISLGNAFAFLVARMVLLPIAGLWGMVTAIVHLGAVALIAGAKFLIAFGPEILIIAGVAAAIAGLIFLFIKFRKTIVSTLEGIGKFIHDVLFVPIDKTLSFISSSFFNFFANILKQAARLSSALGLDSVTAKLKAGAKALEDFGTNSGHIVGDAISAGATLVSNGVSDTVGAVKDTVNNIVGLAKIGFNGLVDDAKAVKDKLLATLNFSNVNPATSPINMSGGGGGGLGGVDNTPLTEVVVGAKKHLPKTPTLSSIGGIVDDAGKVKNIYKEVTDSINKNMLHMKKNTLETWGQLLKEGSKFFKAFSVIQKIFAIKSVIISTAQGIAQAFKLGFPAMIPAIAFVAARGAVELAQIRGQAHDGIDNVPSTGTYLLQSGERVVDRRLNKDLSSYLAKSGNSTTNQSSNAVLNFNVTGTDPAGLERTLQNNRGQFEQMLRDIYAENALPDPLSA